jgi:hypothetical protein
MLHYIFSTTEVLIQLSSLPRYARVLLVTEEKAESEVMKVSLEQAGIHHLNLQATDEEDLQRNPKIREQVELVVVAPTIENYVRQQFNQVNQVIVLNFRLDLDNISLLKARLAAIQSSRTTASN